MKTFREFLEESFKFSKDNPGGEWEKHEQSRADNWIKKYNGNGSYGKGLGGSVTGSIRGLKINPKHIKHLHGAEDEHSFAQSDSEMNKFSKRIGGKENFNTKDNPILIGVNHKGEAHVLEGNHRLAYANRFNIPHIHTDVSYFNGGEKVKGNYHPDKFKEKHIDEDI